MKIPWLQLTIALHILGLTAISVLESLRPGSVTSAINIGFVWLVSLVLVGLLISRQQKTDAK